MGKGKQEDKGGYFGIINQYLFKMVGDYHYYYGVGTTYAECVDAGMAGQL